jgi:methionyl-tRNA formyltransferase
MKLVYVGSPEAAVAPLQTLVAAGHEIVMVLSQPDRKRGRGSALVASPVKAAALELGLAVTDRPDDLLDAAAAGAQLGVVVAYGRLIKPHLLAALPFINLHFSLLPRWRGAAPVERAVLAGDTETGVCLMALEAGLDTGPVYERVIVPIDESESVAVLRDRLVDVGVEMMVRRLADGFVSLGSAIDQVGESTYAAKLDPAEFVLDFAKPADELARLVRLGFAWTTVRGKRLKVLEARPYEAAGVADSMGAVDVVGAVHGAGAGLAPGALGKINGVVVVGCGLPSRATSDSSGDELSAVAGQAQGELLNGSKGEALVLITVHPEGKGPMAAAAWANGLGRLEETMLGQ